MSKRNSLLFTIIKNSVRLFYPKIELVGKENLPCEPCVVVGNHCQLHGPVSCELYFPHNFYTWCASQIMTLKEVPSYTYKDFWSQKKKVLRPFFKLVSFLIAPLSVVIFNNARTIAVYKDNRILNTFRQSVEHLKNNNCVIVFPEYDKLYNNILYSFQEGFVDIARIYHTCTKKELSFVPLYIAPRLRKMYLGKPIKFSSVTPIADERRRICDYIMDEITNIARNLPCHTVIPYRNIPKKFYPKSKEKNCEKTRS